MNPELRYHLSAFLRRLPLFLMTSVGITAIAFFLAITLPTVYSAKATMLVESAQIPGNLAVSTVQLNPNEQLEIVQQRLMTRANLIEIARKFDVYEDLSTLNPDKIVARMRSDTEFRSSSGRNRATLLEVEFFARSGTIAAQVTNEFITRLLADNARQRMRQAGDTQDFFQQEVDRLGTELELQSQKILKFQNENADALPDGLDFRLNRQSLLQERLSQLSRDRASLEDQRTRIVEIYNRTGAVRLGPAENLSPDEQQLEVLRNELNSALSIYSEGNPRVKILRARVEKLEAQVQEAGQALNQSEDGEQVSILDLQLSEIDSRLAFLETQGVEIAAELASLEEAINRTPNNSVVLAALERDYENVQQQYNQAVDRLSTAVTGERIEVLSKGQRISVIEQAIAPTDPDSPNRPLIAGGGTVLGIAAGFGLVVLLEMMNKAIHRPIDLTRGLGITPLATVPYIDTSGEMVRRRMLRTIILLALLAGIPAMLYYVHYQITPLDLLLQRVMDRMEP